jgi:hypothetical protein
MHSVRPLGRTATIAAALALSLTSGAPAFASNVAVDPNTLVPPPVPGTTCTANGAHVLCTITVDVAYTNEPWLELPCGVVYATGRDVREARRSYENGLLVRRHVHEDAEAVWSLSPTGASPLVSAITHTNWGEVYTVPGDLSSAVGHQEGTDLLVRSTNGGVVWQISGQTHAEEAFTGHFLVDEPPPIPITSPAIGDLCAALGA